jgi:hypothetical protein
MGNFRQGPAHGTWKDHAPDEPEGWTTGWSGIVGVRMHEELLMGKGHSQVFLAWPIPRIM